MLSQASEYGLRAAIELARGDPDEWRLAGDLAQRLEIPVHYLAKILQLMVRRRILISQRGRQGGFRLARPAAKITAWDVVNELEDMQRMQQCIIGERTCNEKTPCPLHVVWKDVRAKLFAAFENTTLAEMARKSSTSGRQRKAAH